MSNHFHFVLVPEREDSLAVLFGRANGRYAQALNIRKGRSGHLWQARSHSCVMAGSPFWVGARCGAGSPCRAGVVGEAADYPGSSAAAHLLGKPGRSHVLDLEFWEQAGGAATWAEM